MGLDWDPCSVYHLDLDLVCNFVLGWDHCLGVHLGPYWDLLLALPLGWERGMNVGIALDGHLALGLGSMLSLSLGLGLGLGL